MNLFVKIIRRLKCAINGILFAIFNDRSYRLQIIGGFLVIGLFSYWQWPLTKIELLFLGLAWILILITELQNSSFESALDHLHPEVHESVRISKDMAAGAVLIAGFFLLFVMTVIIAT